MHAGELVDENNASPYDKGYGVRVRNSKTGDEMWTPASYLKRLQAESMEQENQDADILNTGAAAYLKTKGYDDADIIDKYKEVSGIMAAEGSDYYAEPDDILARIKEMGI